MVETTKDLGVAIDTSFKPSLQCREGFAVACAVFLMMRWGFAELTPAIFRPLYLAMVRPQLDFAVQAVAPNLQKYLKLVGRMQRLATRCVKGIHGLQYPARLRELQFPFMQSHILRSTLIMAYNLFHGNLNLPLEEFSRCASCEPPSWASIRGPAASIPIRPTASSIRSSSGRALI